MSRSNLRLLILALSLLSLTAAAGDKPRLVVVPFATGEGASEVATGKFTSVLIDELKTRNEVLELASPPALKSATPDKPATGGKKGPSTDAVGAMEDGRKAFDELRFDDATVSLKKGIDTFLADPATADFDSVIDGYVKLAAAYFRMGEEKDAKLALAELCRLAPNYELASGFPPVFQHELEKAKKRIDKQPKGALSIDGPPGATAFIDGRDLGMVPISDEVVTVGIHYVKVEGTKTERFGQAVDVKGPTKVRASFGGASERSVVKASDAPVENPRISATVDEGVQQRLAAYVKAANADFALVGFVYKTAETQLTAGTALYSAKKNAFTSLQTTSFDTDVMTANTEAFKLAEDLVKRMNGFAASTLPINLATKARLAVVAKNDARINPDDVDAAAPTTTVRPTKKQPVLVPKEKPEPTTRTLENPSVVEVDSKNDGGDKPPEVQKSGVPVWVWVVTGVAVAAGAGVGGYFGYTAITKPVTGTVTATW